MTKFAAHGSFLLSTEGRILVSTMHGPFNAECAHVYLRAALPLIRELAKSGPWAGLTEFSESALFPLEMAAIMRSQTIVGVQQLRMVANCWVVPPSVEGYGIVDKQALSIYHGVLPFRMFEHRAAARAWLESQLSAQH